MDHTHFEFFDNTNYIHNMDFHILLIRTWASFSSRISTRDFTVIEEMTKTNDSKHPLLYGRYQGHFKDALVHSPGCIPFGVERSNRDRAVVPSLPKKRAALYPGAPEIGEPSKPLGAAYHIYFLQS